MPKVIHTKLNTHKYYILYIMSFISITMIFGILIPFYISEVKTEAAFGTATQSTISLSLSSNNIALNLLQPGTYDANNLDSGIFGSASTTASVSTTNYTGYTLSIAANSSTNAGKLVDSSNSDTSKNYFSSIESATSESVFSNSSNTSYNGKWGYKPSYYNSVANTNYLPAPSTTGTTINSTVCPNATSGSTGIPTTNCTNATDTYTFTLGARANINQSAGSYSNTFNIVATANPVTYAITYADNSGDSSVSNLPSVQASSLNAQSKLNSSTISLSSTIPTRTGYTFNKWCLGSVSNSGTTCTGTEYNAGADFGIDQTTDNSNITLYATWTINQYTCTKRYRLQNADGTYPSSYTSDGSSQINHGSTCSYSKSVTNYQTQSTSQANMTGAVTLSLSLPRNTYALTINRNTTYISSVSGAGTYRWGQSVSISATAASNSTFTSWSQTSGTAGSFTSTTSASTTFTMPTSAATIYADGQIAKTYMQDYTLSRCSTEASSGNVTLYDKRDEKTYTVRYINNACWMTSNLRFTDANLSSSTTNINTAKTISYGSLLSGNSYTEARIYASSNSYSGGDAVWYNYAAASAMTVTGEYNASDAIYDICPKGWHMPSYDIEPGSAQGITSYKNSFNPVYGGGYNGGTLFDPDRRGYWWTSTANGNDSSYYIDYDNGNLYARSFYRYDGFYVRCVMSDKPYIQDYTIAACASEASAGQKRLYDIRDGKSYTIRYINNACWMTQNLAFTGTSSDISGQMTLKTATSNIDVDKTLAYGDQATNGGSWTAPRLHIPNSTKDSAALALYTSAQIGAWYNYAAASGGTITGTYNSTTATYDICPKGWHLPANNTTPGAFVDVTNYVSSFNPIYGGFYFDDGNSGSQSEAGYFWSATPNGSTMRHAMMYKNGTLYAYHISNENSGNRIYGFYVRCVKTS